MFYSYSDYTDGINTISDQVLRSNVKYDYIVGICRGGLIPATSLSYKLKIPLRTITIQTYDEDYIDLGQAQSLTSSNKILIVDDIIDSGDTIVKLFEIWQNYNIDVACLVFNEGQTKAQANYTHRVINKKIDPSWITFWWDCNSDE